MHTFKETEMTATHLLFAIPFITAMAFAQRPDPLFSPSQFLGFHEEAAAASHPVGKVINNLEILGSRVIMGHGHWQGQNLNEFRETSIREYDLLSGDMPLLLESPTDGIHNIRKVGNRVIVPHTDPTQGEFRPGGMAFRDAQGAWVDLPLIPDILHFFDATEYKGAIYLVGSGGNGGAIAYRSFDGGSNWQLFREPGGFRYYSAFILNGLLWMSHRGPLGSTFTATDGTTIWEEIQPAGMDQDPPRLFSIGSFFWSPDVVAGVAVGRSGAPGTSVGPMQKFSGWSIRNMSISDLTIDGVPSAKAYDHFLGGNRLFVLLENLKVVSTTDLVNWRTEVRRVLPTSRSIAATTENIIIGESTGGLRSYKRRNLQLAPFGP